MPTGLDWISVDYCEWPCLFFARRLRADRAPPTTDPDEGTAVGKPHEHSLGSGQTISETSVRAGARKLFEQHLYPIMAPHQQALFVPPAYGCNDTACANIDSSKRCFRPICLRPDVCTVGPQVRNHAVLLQLDPRRAEPSL